MQILKWDRLSCFGHNLHLAITNSMKNDTCITQAVEVAHKIINTFAHSCKKCRDLAKVQVELKLPTHSLITVCNVCRHNIIQKYVPSYLATRLYVFCDVFLKVLPSEHCLQECITWWGTRYKMMKRLIEQERAICQVLSMDPKSVYLKSRWQDTEVMECIATALSPVSDLIDILLAEEKVTACLRPLISHLCEVLACREGDPELKVDIQEKIVEYMKGKYEDTTVKELINISTCSDPRFMLNYCTQEEAILEQQNVVEEGKLIARRLEEEINPSLTQSSESTLSTELSQHPDPHPPSKKRKLVDILTKVSTSRNEVLNNEDRIQNELTIGTCSFLSLK